MKDLQNIVRRARELDKEGLCYVLATVVQTSGSVYRGPGTRMLIEENLRSLGTISGGCLEGDLHENASEVFTEGTPRLLHYDATSEDDILWGTGLGCNGTIDILLEKLPRAENYHYPDLLYDSALGNQRGVLISVFAVAGETTAAPGQHLVLDEKGNATDDIADRQQREVALAAARASLAELDHTHLPVVPGRTQHCEWAQCQASLLIEPLLPPITFYIFGAGYDALPLAHFAADLGWRVTVSDHRPSYADYERFPQAQRVLLTQPGHLPADLSFDSRSAAVIISHNYLQDQALLSGLIDTPLAYLGILGPRERTQRLLAELEREGAPVTDTERNRLFSPIGLDIGAETAEAIALSILGEVQAVLTGRKGGKLRDHLGPIHDRPT